jgi:hypothetical protein
VVLFEHGHLFIHSGPIPPGDPPQVKHYDAEGNFLEFMDVQGTGGIFSINQWQDTLYILSNSGDDNVLIEEYDNEGNFLRIACHGVDPDDPLQNPGGETPGTFVLGALAVDHHGNFYASPTYSNVTSHDVYMWDNSGSFITRFVNADPYTANSLITSTVDPCELIVVNNVGSPNIARYNVCTRQLTENIETLMGWSGWASSDMHCTGRLYKPFGDPFTTTGVRIYDTDWTVLGDLPFEPPDPLNTLELIRVIEVPSTPDAGKLWAWSAFFDPGPGQVGGTWMYQLRLSNAELLIEPILVNDPSIHQKVNAVGIWRDPCPLPKPDEGDPPGGDDGDGEDPGPPNPGLWKLPFSDPENPSLRRTVF